MHFFAFSTWIAIHVQEMDSLRCSDLLHGRAQKVQLPNEVQSNSCCSHGFPDVWLSNSVFSEFFRLFESKSRSIGLSAKKSYFNCIFYQGHVILWKRNNYRAIFSSFSSFFLLCLHNTLWAPVIILLQASVFIVRAETPGLANKVSVLLCRITGFTKNDF